MVSIWNTIAGRYELDGIVVWGIKYGASRDSILADWATLNLRPLPSLPRGLASEIVLETTNVAACQDISISPVWCRA